MIKYNRRDSNIELFRIVLMFMVISHHYVVNSGITASFDFSSISNHMLFYQFIGAFGKVGINCFLIITGYFMCDKKVNMKKFWSLLFTILFYKILFNFLFIICGYLPFDINYFINEIPIIMFLKTGNDSFTALYLMLFLLIPYLNMIVNSCSKEKFQRLLFILLFVFTFISTFINDNWEGLGWYCTAYLIGSYIKKGNYYIFNNFKFSIVSTVIGFFLAFLSIILIDYGIINKDYNYYFYVIGCNKLLAIYIAVSLFLLFKNLRIQYNKSINKIASATFGVFLIHTNSDTMRKFLWQDLLHVVDYYSSSFLVSFCHWLFSIIVIYIYCVIIELARIKLFRNCCRKKVINLKKIVLLVLFSFILMPNVYGISSGWNTINGQQYYYDSNGEMYRGVHKIEGKLYYFGAVSGKLYKGWIDAPDGNKYFAGSDGILSIGFTKIGDNIYYFDTTGKMYKSIHEIEGKLYYFGAIGGTLYKGWIDAPDGNRYYSDSAGVMYRGVHEIEGNLYYFGAVGGKLYKGWIDAPDGNKYYANNDGVLSTGWFELKGEKYYSDETGKIFRGWKDIDGKTYYFDEFGKMYKSIHEIEGKLYYFGAIGGTLYKGWIDAPDGNRYYSDSAGVMYRGVHEIEGKLYYFGAVGGKLYKGWIDASDGNKYYADNNGVLSTGWFELKGEKYYSDEIGRVVRGWKDIDDKTYYFDEFGKMYKSIHEIEGKLYYFGAIGGTLYKGWIDAPDGNRYYSDSAGVMYRGVHEIEGNLYYFGAIGGTLYKDWIDAPDGNKYYADNNGVLSTGWFELKGEKYYSDETGKIFRGWKDIDGKTYYFDVTGKMYKSIHEIEGKLYYFGAIGGTLYKGWIDAPDGNRYYSDSAGVMYRGVHEIEGKLYYFGAVGGKLYKGWIDAPDGNKYYANNEGVLLTGDVQIKSNWYRFNSSGVLENGWQVINNNKYYYYSDGSIAKGITNIAGINYYFDSNGILKMTNVKKVIDVSSHQGVINWDKVYHENDIDGAIIRIGYGTSYTTEAPVDDKYFKRNVDGANKYNLLYGIYLYSYAIDDVSAAIEANYVGNTLLKNGISKDIVIYYDLEENAWTTRLSVIDYDKIVRTFINTLASYGYTSKVYSYKFWAENRFSEYVRSNLTWIAQYSDEVTYKGSYLGWQYTSSGRVFGINGDVDISIFK